MTESDPEITSTDDDSSVSYNSEDERQSIDDLEHFLGGIDSHKRNQMIPVPEPLFDFISIVCDDEYSGDNKKRSRMEKIRFVTIVLASLGVPREYMSNSSTSQLLEKLDEIKRDAPNTKITRGSMVYILDLFHLDELVEFVNNPKTENWIRAYSFYEEVDYSIKKTSNQEKLEEQIQERERSQLRKLISELKPSFENTESDSDEKRDCMKFCSETKRLYHKLGVLVVEKFIDLYETEDAMEECVTKICACLAINKNFKLPFLDCECIKIPRDFVRLFNTFSGLVKDEEPRITILSLLTIILCQAWSSTNPVKKYSNIRERISAVKDDNTRNVMDRIKSYIEFGGSLRKMKPHPFMICLNFNMPELCVALIEAKIITEMVYFDEMTHCVSNYNIRGLPSETVTPMNIVLQSSDESDDDLTNSKLYLVAKMIECGCNPMKRGSYGTTTAFHTLLLLPILSRNKEGLAIFSDILYVMVEGLSLDRDYMDLLFQSNDGGECIMELMVAYKPMFLPQLFEAIRAHFKNRSAREVIFRKIFEGYYVAPAILHIYSVLKEKEGRVIYNDWLLIDIARNYVKETLVEKRTGGVNITKDYCSDAKNVIKEILLYIHTLFNKSNQCTQSWELMGYVESPFDVFCVRGCISGVMAVLAAQNAIRIVPSEMTGRNISSPLIMFMEMVLDKTVKKADDVVGALVKLNIIAEKLMFRLGYSEVRDQEIPYALELSKNIIHNLELVDERSSRDTSHKSFQINRFIGNIKKISFVTTDENGNIDDVKVFV